MVPVNVTLFAIIVIPLFNIQNEFISKSCKVSKQIKSVSAMFLNNPHGVSGNYGAIVKKVGNKIFNVNDKMILYYTRFFFHNTIFHFHHKYYNMSLSSFENLIKLPTVGNKIFNVNDKMILYYTSSLAQYKIEKLISAKVIDKKYNKSRYHAIVVYSKS